MRVINVSISGLLRREKQVNPEEAPGVRVLLDIPLVDGLCMSCRFFLLPFTGQDHARSQPKDKSSAGSGRNVRQNVIITPNLGLAFDFRIRSRLTFTKFTI